MVEIDQPGYDKDEVVILKRPKRFDLNGVTKRPCVRESLLYSLNVGVVCGLARFMMTSSFKKGLMWAVGSYWASVLVIYNGCAIKKINDKHQVHQLEPVLQSYAEIYGTEKDKITRRIKDED